MRRSFLAAIPLLTAAVSIGTAQEPVGLIVRNPYYHAEIQAAPPTAIAPTSFVAPPLQLAPAATPPHRATSFETMQALRKAVHSTPTSPHVLHAAATAVPGRFVPAADATPIAGESGSSPASPGRSGLLNDALAAKLEVTRLSSNPLRESTPNASTIRIVNPLR